MTLVYPQKVTLYQAGDLVEGASFNNFLVSIYPRFLYSSAVC
jgi:tripeptidyl-peptidase-1